MSATRTKPSSASKAPASNGRGQGKPQQQAKPPAAQAPAALVFVPAQASPLPLPRGSYPTLGHFVAKLEELTAADAGKWDAYSLERTRFQTSAAPLWEVFAWVSQSKCVPLGELHTQQSLAELRKNLGL